MIAKLIFLVFIATSFLNANDINSTKVTFKSKTWDLGVQASYMYEGDEGDYLQDAGGIGAHLGYRYSDSMVAIIEVTYINDDTTLDIGSVTVIDYSLGTTYDFFAEDDLYTPYVSLAFMYRTISDEEKDNGWSILPGVGIKFLIIDSLEVFAEGKYRHNLERTEKGLSSSIGIKYKFD